LAGDLNAKLPFWNSAVSNTSSKKLLDLFDVNELKISVPQCPTHYSSAGNGDILDIVAHHSIKLSGVIVSDILDPSHLPIILWCVGWYMSQIRGLLRRLIGFITTSVTHALLITITSKQYSSIVDLHFTIQFFIFTNNLPWLPATDNCRELSGVLPVSRYINSAPTAQETQLCCLLALTTQKTSHAFFIVAC
jgi:hypothetical protein